MNQLQIAQQVKYLLQTRYWAGNSSNSRVFGKVVISAFDMRDILSRGPRLPLAVVRVGNEINDDDFPELVLDAGITVDIVTRVMTDEFGEASIIGGNRASLTASEGRGLGEVVAEALAAVQFIDPESSLTLFSRIEGGGAVTQLKDSFYKTKSLEISAEGSTAAFYQPGRAISNSGNTVTWSNPADRFDFHAAISGLGISARGGIVLRYASGSTAPATTTSDSGATLSTVYDESYTHGTDGQGSGTFSYSLFIGYDLTGDGTIDAIFGGSFFYGELLMPTITRSYSIEYGSTVIGGASDKFILRKRGFGIFESYRNARITFEVIVRGDTVTEFKDNNIELLDAFRTPRQRVQVKCPTDLRDYDPSSSVNLGFDAEPDIEVVNERLNGPKFQNYRCSINLTLPADLSGQDGRRDNKVDTATESNRRLMVTLSGIYTALTTNDATAQYNAEIQNHADAVLPAGNWQYLKQNVSRNDTDKVVNFSRIYREITHDQGNGSATHASVIEQEITISRNLPGAQNTFINGRTTKPLAVYSIKYNAVIDKSVTGSTALKALYDDELRAKVLADVTANLASPAGGSTDNESIVIDLENNVITATFDFRKPNGSGVIKSRMTKDLVNETGVSLIPVTTGLPHHYAEDDGPPSLILRVMIEETIVSGTFSRYATPKGFILLRESESATQVEEGYFPSSLTLKTKSRNYEFKYSIPYKGGGSSGSTVARKKKASIPTTINNFNGQGI